MSKLHNMETIVELVLEEWPVTREHDCLLMVGVCKKLGIDIYNISFRDAMVKRKKLNIPNWETVTRCRRKIQERRRDLVSMAALKRRQEAEANFRDYSKEA